MVSDHVFYQLGLLALVWLCLMLHWAWRSDTTACPMPPAPSSPLPKRRRESQPFTLNL